MQVSDIIKTGDFNNKSYNSMIPIIRILKVFAINGNVAPNKTSMLIKSICACSIFGCLSSYCLYYKTKYVYNRLDISIRVTDMAQMICDFFQYTVDLFFVYKFGRNLYIEYFRQFEIIDVCLETSCYAEMKRRLLKTMTFFLVIWFISSFTDLGAWVITYGWMIPVVHSLSYLYLLIKILATLDLIANIIQVEVRLRIINNFIKNCYKCASACPVGILADCIRNKNWLHGEDGSPDQSLKARSIDSHEIKRLSKCYLLLTEQVMFINKMYGFRILLNTTSLLFDMVKILNLAIRIIVGSQRTLYNSAGYNFLPGVSGFVRFLTCAAILITLVNRCEQAYRQRERILNVIDHLLINKNPDLTLRSAIQDLQSLLQDRPICFNMAGFFTLNFSLLVSIASVVVTYTIILLQSVN
ncbi:uncharacterized protein LOC110372862 [Helicoverpa armigera]|uniref:uncharacterized protein LOC110372862 n=1 Tax=Helicoverpa armigera TaxID=29058 RepID=UPI0030837DC6